MARTRDLRYGEPAPKLGSFDHEAENFDHEAENRRLKRELARASEERDIEMFYNPKRKHTNKGMPSHVDFETGQRKLNGAGV
jgi:hypothetical protein